MEWGLNNTMHLVIHVCDIRKEHQSGINSVELDSMWPDRVSNSGPLALETDAQPTTLQPGIIAIKILYFDI